MHLFTKTEDLDDLEFEPFAEGESRPSDSMEDPPENSDGNSIAAVSSEDDEEVHGTEPESEEAGEWERAEEEYIGVDPQENRDSPNFEGFADLLSTEIEVKEEEIEIKEEEIELDPDLLPGEDEEGEDPFGETMGGTSTDTADEGEDEPARKQQKVGKNVLVKLRQPEPKRKPAVPKVAIYPQFVPGLMVKRNSNLQCLECGLCFNSPYTFAAHRKQLHVQLPEFLHACSYCERRFNEREDLQRHLLHHTRMETFRCSVCHLGLNSSKALVDHLVRHREQDENSCNLCFKVFTSPEQLEAHNVELHTKLSKISKTMLPSDIVCFACGKMEKHAKDLRVHMQRHKGQVRCKVCNSAQHNMDKLYQHVTKFHRDTRKMTYDCCPNCSEVHLSHQQMIEHKESCLLPPSLYGRFRLECHICQLSYFDVEHYETHMRLHAALGQESDRKPCRLCSFFAKNTSEYALHMTRVHGFRDTIDSLEHDFDNVPGLKCIAPKCKQIAINYLPDVRAQPDQWNRLLCTFQLPMFFKPKPTYRICSNHLAVFNRSAD
ncbi:hypothetical protein pipiens_014279 [Culex pipiens pipiens]|uniref:C2H2-type domain-containing protein n=1 Tax=Culex pipiens pipiens TaxID=38569 RepID=A0ABD1CV91_CULPP